MSEITKVIKIALEADAQATVRSFAKAMAQVMDQVNRGMSSPGAGGKPLKLFDKNQMVAEYAAAMREINNKGISKISAVSTQELDKGLKEIRATMKAINDNSEHYQKSLEATNLSEEKRLDLLKKEVAAKQELLKLHGAEREVIEAINELTTKKGDPPKPGLLSNAFKAAGGLMGIGYGINQASGAIGRYIPGTMAEAAAGASMRHESTVSAQHGDFNSLFGQALFASDMNTAQRNSKLASQGGVLASMVMGAGTGAGFGALLGPKGLGVGAVVGGAVGLGQGIFNYAMTSEQAQRDARNSTLSAGLELTAPVQNQLGRYLGMNAATVGAMRQTGLSAGRLAQIDLGNSGLLHGQAMQMKSTIAGGYAEHAWGRSKAGIFSELNSGGVDLGSMLSSATNLRQASGRDSVNEVKKLLTESVALGTSKAMSGHYAMAIGNTRIQSAGGFGRSSGSMAEGFIKDFLGRRSAQQGGELNSADVGAAQQAMGAFNGMVTASGGLPAIGGFRAIGAFASANGLNMSASSAAMMQKEGMMLPDQAIADMIGSKDPKKIAAKKKELFGHMFQGQLDTTFGQRYGSMDKYKSGGLGALSGMERVDFVSAFGQSKGLGYAQSEELLRIGQKGNQISNDDMARAGKILDSGNGAMSQADKMTKLFETLASSDKAVEGFSQMVKTIIDDAPAKAAADLASAYDEMAKKADLLSGAMLKLVEPGGAFDQMIDAAYKLSGGVRPPSAPPETTPGDVALGAFSGPSSSEFWSTQAKIGKWLKSK